MIDGLEELRELGAGAQGRVYLARRADGEVVAVKELTRGGEGAARERFRQEAALLARLDDPHVARFYGLVERDGALAIVMEAVPGATLRAVLDEHRTLEPVAAAAVLKGSLLGLAAAHRVGVVHRDYKPANVLVRKDGLSKLVDFGVAVLTGMGGRSGTPAYMSPEQWLGGPASAATDLYAATCVFFECLAGRRPFEGNLEEGHLREPVPLELVPEELRGLVERGMAKVPGLRLWNAEEFATALEATAAAAYGDDWEKRGLAVLGGTAGAVAGAAAITVGATAGGSFLASGAGKVALGVAGVLAIGGAIVALRPGEAKEPEVRPVAAWTLTPAQAGFQPWGPMYATPGGFVLPDHPAGRAAGVVGIDGATGRQRWYHRTSGTKAIPGHGQHLIVHGRTVIFEQQPGGGNAAFGFTADVVAVDAVTGQKRWSFGGGRRGLLGNMIGVTNVLPCGPSGGHVCVASYVVGTDRNDEHMIDIATGRATRLGDVTLDLKAAPGLRIGGGQTADGTRIDPTLVRVDVPGRPIWRRPVGDVFGPGTYYNGLGWEFARSGDVFVGWISTNGSYTGTTSKNPRRRALFMKDDVVFKPGLATTAAFSASTGRPLWRRPSTTGECGGLELDAAHPVVCRTAGEIRPDAKKATGIDVWMDGVDPATGKTRWTWHAGNVRGLAVDDPAEPSVLRVDDRTYLIGTAQGRYLLNVETGPQRIPDDRVVTGWCGKQRMWVGQRGHLPLSTPFNPADSAYWPCDSTGARRPLPTAVPAFAGQRTGDVFAWQDEKGIHAVRVPRPKS